MFNSMENRKNFDYDESTDSLIISNKTEQDVVKENFMFGDIVLSLTYEGKISGIEILDVSNYLREVGMNPEMLQHIKSIELRIVQKRDSVVIMFNINSVIGSKMQENKIPLGMFPIMAH